MGGGSLGHLVNGSHLLPLMNRLPYSLGWDEGLVLMATPSGIFTYGDIS